MYSDKPFDLLRRPLLRALFGACALVALGGPVAAQTDAAQADAAQADAAQSDAAQAVASEPQTVTEAVPPETDTTTVIDNAAPVVNASAPRTYVVQRGDTLWGIAGMFLRDPWLWPEIWYVNPQINNPHLIYPGDTLALTTGADGKQSLVLTRGSGARLSPLLRSQPLDGPISTIPYTAIASFLSRPGLISRDEAKAAPYVVSLRDDHLIAGAGNELYVRQLAGEVGERFNVMHVGKPLKDPDGREQLGYMAVFTGVAQVTKPGEISTATLVESAMETLQGDVLVPDTGVATLNLAPHAPARPVTGHIMAVVNGVFMAGQFRVVAVNRGTDQGLDPGAVLRVNEEVQTTRDRCAHINDSPTCHRGKTSLPLEASGTLLVFKTYPRMSYGLVINELRPILVGDQVVNP